MKISQINIAKYKRKAKKVLTNKQLITAFVIAATTMNAHALSIDTGFLTTIGCGIYEYLTGPLASWAFAIVLGGAIVMGLITNIDWGRIVMVVAIFAVVQSLAMLIIENPTAAKYLGSASCLRSA